MLAQRLLTVPGAREVIDADYGVLDEAARWFASIHELEAEPFLIAVVSAIPKVRSAGGRSCGLLSRRGSPLWFSARPSTALAAPSSLS
jgi:hypothetical protein